MARLAVSLLLATIGVASVGYLVTGIPPAAIAQPAEPIGGIGHGVFFDQAGKPIVPTAEFVAGAQAWYRQVLAEKLDDAGKRQIALMERKLRAGLKGQARLVADQRVLKAIVEALPREAVDHRMEGKINLLSARLQFELARPGDGDLLGRKAFVIDDAVKARLEQPGPLPRLRSGGVVIMAATIRAGQDYIDECAAARVPIPPPINRMASATVVGWTSQGFIPTGEQFITGTAAEVRTFSNGDGMCIALPRASSMLASTAQLDGVICLSQVTSKVCFWDNQMNRVRFNVPNGQQIPIGRADLTVDPAGRYQAGGFELERGSGGVCTDCHAGENPYIVHPNAVLRTVAAVDFTMGQLKTVLPMFGPTRYDPIVPASWPQNSLSQSPALVPPGCITCHVQGNAGRLPHISTELNVGTANYCTRVLTPAIARTMPTFAPGSLAGTPEVNALIDWCDQSVASGPSNRGDPHVRTTDGTPYDFQSAGEFTALRNSDTGFEVQTRQTPVLTGARIGPNPHTGLGGCVSVNTAAAVRVGKRRLSYQSGDQRGREPMVLRVDGRPLRITAGKTDLGGGATVRTVASGSGVDIRSADGDRVVLTPHFWDSQGVWYLDVDVTGSPAREGVMGGIGRGQWLPFAPDGSGFGAAPATLADRHVLLNVKFADAWRVAATSSLFDYAPGTDTTRFTDRDWPSPPGGVCTSANVPAIGERTRIKPIKATIAKRLCAKIEDPAARRSCIFDTGVMGDTNVPAAYIRSLANRNAP